MFFALICDVKKYLSFLVGVKEQCSLHGLGALSVNPFKLTHLHKPSPDAQHQNNFMEHRHVVLKTLWHYVLCKVRVLCLTLVFRFLVSKGIGPFPRFSAPNIGLSNRYL